MRKVSKSKLALLEKKGAVTSKTAPPKDPEAKPPENNVVVNVPETKVETPVNVEVPMASMAATMQAMQQANLEVISHQNLTIQKLDETISEIAKTQNDIAGKLDSDKVPIPWKIKVNRNSKGFISSADILPVDKK